RIITDIAGYTSCLLTEPVYSINGRNLLLPKGSKIYGAYGGGPTGKRVEVIWDRITTPNGIDVAMSSPGVDQLGGAGHPGQYSAHWGSRIASALMISLLADAFKYA
ncbi:TrbI/VirB10 family protein, partial [Mesorhizobium sp. M8A.F.Ca.ET.142.01.1.1]